MIATEKSHAVKMLAGAVVIWSLDWAGESTPKMAHSNGYWLKFLVDCWQGSSVPHNADLSLGLLKWPNDMAVGLEWGTWKTEQGGDYSGFSERHYLFCHILFIGSISLSSANTQEKPLFFAWRTVNEFIDIFSNHHKRFPGFPWEVSHSFFYIPSVYHTSIAKLNCYIMN